MTDNVETQFAALADIIQEAAGGQFRPTGHLVSNLRHAIGGGTPVFAAASLEVSEDDRHTGTIILFTDSLVAVAEIADSPTTIAWTSQHGSISISIARRDALRSLNLSLREQAVQHGRELAAYERFPWNATIVATYEGLSAPVEITNNRPNLDAGGFYGQLLGDLAAN